MITKELIKNEIEKLQDEYLEILYKIIKAFEALSGTHTVQSEISLNAAGISNKSVWHEFVKETYGSLADSPIERGEQGIYEIREVIK